MRKFITCVKAVDPSRNDRRLFKYYGPVIEAENPVDAQRYCNTNGLGYCKVLGLFIRDVIMPSGTIATLYYDKDRDN